MGSGTGDKAEGKVDELKGEAKQKIGDLTEDEDLQAEGKKDELKGEGKGALGTVKNAGEDLKERAKDALDKE
jgi:uncharacterized protein YjbJ (UPF0337 family)